VNSRDLVSLKVVPGRLDQLADLLPRDNKRVAESGVATPDDAARMAAKGYDLALVGSALMAASDPHALASAMLGKARAARASADFDRASEAIPK
jgi:indole-3-glycerol phosphate synthase